MTGRLFDHEADERGGVRGDAPGKPRGRLEAEPWGRRPGPPHGPLAARLRPQTLDEVVGQPHLIGPGGPLRAAIEADQLTSVLFWGPPGTGKTTLAHVVAASTQAAFYELSAVTAGVRDVRQVVDQARTRRRVADRQTVLFVDEIHRFNKAQQDALLPGVEDGSVVLIGATTENPSFEVNAPLLSRSLLYRLEPLAPDDLRTLIDRACRDERGLPGLEVTPEAVEALVVAADGDARVALTGLEAAAILAAGEAPRSGAEGGDQPGEAPRSGAEGGDQPGEAPRSGAEGGDQPGEAVGPEHVQAALAQPHLRYDKAADQHYDQVSAFIKSMRGSDPDAALYWLVRMLESGEDPRFLARRMVILAGEDVGLADPQALVVAVSAATALEFVGLPEARFALAEAVLYLALAPKSNSVTSALGRAVEAVRRLGNAPVPVHLRDAHYRGARRLGHGVGYRYPHDEEGGWVDQRYLPEGLERGDLYHPSPHGAEPDLGTWRPNP